MNSFLLLMVLLLLGVIVLLVPSGASAVLIGIPLAVIILFILSRIEEHRRFIVRLFVASLLARILIGTIIYTAGLQEFFGGDAYTYDTIGYALLKYWQGDGYYLSMINVFTGNAGASGWGMAYMVAAIYALIGRNMFAIQLVNAVIGAATAPVIFYCAQQLLNNTRVSRLAAIFVGFYPSLILWSSQGLKDGPIIFLLALSMLATLKLGEKLSFKYLVILLACMMGLFSLRFYIFYMLVVAVGGSFIVGTRQIAAQSVVRQFVILSFLGLAITYLGVLRTASTQLETYGSLEAVQRSRSDLAGAKSGFQKDVDVSTTSGAISTIPVGLLYLLFAPFPWQLASLRQSITFPEMIIWWTSFPLLILGLWFIIKYNLRKTLPILLFTMMLTLAYSVFQGNIGTAYRQRAQLLIFYFIFVATGYVLFQEKREEQKRQELAAVEEEKRRVISGISRRPTTNI